MDLLLDDVQTGWTGRDPGRLRADVDRLQTRIARFREWTTRRREHRASTPGVRPTEDR
ncbi:hypothetical protein [Saccharothrix syringae]|uniref:hypothetical protein n=1 Tax=Saccharothrix syringae TaxID=103733 RepID=UPI000B2492C3|nr:hypothetical protein [Saccharothrix syringae]